MSLCAPQPHTPSSREPADPPAAGHSSSCCIPRSGAAVRITVPHCCGKESQALSMAEGCPRGTWRCPPDMAAIQCFRSSTDRPPDARSPLPADTSQVWPTETARRTPTPTPPTTAGRAPRSPLGPDLLCLLPLVAGSDPPTCNEKERKKEWGGGRRLGKTPNKQTHLRRLLLRGAAEASSGKSLSSSEARTWECPARRPRPSARYTNVSFLRRWRCTIDPSNTRSGRPAFLPAPPSVPDSQSQCVHDVSDGGAPRKASRAHG